MTRYEEVAFQLEQRRASLEADLAERIGAVDAALREALPGTRVGVRGRVKSAPSVWLKMHRYGVPYDRVHDLLGVRVIVERVEDCYRAADTVGALWSGRCRRAHDYIATPKDNGYQSLHLCVDLPARPPFEVQIRTRAMDRACGEGAASHSRYKASLWRTFLSRWTKAVVAERGASLEA